MALLAGLRQALDAYGQRATPGQAPYLLTVAAPCSPAQYKLLDIRAMDPYLDFWNLMAYDFSGSWDATANHQANLFHGAVSVYQAVNDYKRAGAPAHKLVIGVPLYGRGFDGTAGAGQPYESVSPGSAEGGIYMYKELPLPGAQEHFSERDGASWSHDGRQWISYDSPQAVRAKAEFIKKQGLRGAMFWELSGDQPAEHERSLVRCMADTVRSPSTDTSLASSTPRRTTSSTPRVCLRMCVTEHRGSLCRPVGRLSWAASWHTPR